MKKWLISWIGETDNRAAEGALATGLGPIATALLHEQYDRVYLLTNYSHLRSSQYCDWLEARTGCRAIDLQEISLVSPIDHAEIYREVTAQLKLLRLPSPEVAITFLLSPGTPAMATIWVLLAKSRFPARLLQTSAQQGVTEVDVGFDLAGDFLPEFLQRSDERVNRLVDTSSTVVSEFAGIVHVGQVMQEQIQRAHRVAVHSVPVLVLGETGTGKELFAEAIHQASGRKGAYVPVNCGAIPKELINSELFGHKKGAFTGADKDRKGHFREAEGGTLFLDEIGDLPLDAQVRLLRALQQKQIVPVGESTSQQVDVRIIAATHRDLQADVAAGRFREDLFHRLAVGIIRLPPLRQRQEDIQLLADYFMQLINRDSHAAPEWQEKHLSDDAKNLLLQHSWPGNVRELYHTLLRASIWAQQRELTASDIHENLLLAPERKDGVLGRHLGQDFDLDKVFSEVESHYLQRAMQQAAGKKKKAAALLGIKNYQTLSNRLKKHGIDADDNDD